MRPDKWPADMPQGGTAQTRTLNQADFVRAMEAWGMKLIPFTWLEHRFWKLEEPVGARG